MDCSMPGFSVLHQFLEIAQTHVIKLVISSNHLIFCHPLLLLPSIFPSNRVFLRSNFFTSVGQSIGVPASASILPMNIQDWFSWLVGAPCSPRDSQESFPTPHSKASILWHSAFFVVQLSRPYTTTGKIIALTKQTFVGKVMPLLCNMLSRLVTAFLPRNKHLLISWLQSPSAVILELRKIKSATVSTVSPSICQEAMGLGALILVFWMLGFKQTFHSPLSLSSRCSLVLHFLP